MSAGQQAAEVQLGGCDAYYGAAGSETHLGLVSEGVMLRLSQATVAVRAAQHGRMPVRHFAGGQEVRVELVLEQIDDVQLTTAIQGAAVGTGADPQVNFGVAAGTALTGKRLRLHPVTQTNSANETADWVIHSAVVVDGPIELKLNAEEPQLVALVLEGEADLTKAAGSYLGRYGKD